MTHDWKVVDPGGPKEEVVRVEAVEAFAALDGLVLAVGRFLIAVQLEKVIANFS